MDLLGGDSSFWQTESTRCTGSSGLKKKKKNASALTGDSIALYLLERPISDSSLQSDAQVSVDLGQVLSEFVVLQESELDLALNR